MKSISPIIASIIIIVITVAFAALLYAFISSTFGNLLSSTKISNQYISFNIVNAYCSGDLLYFLIYNNGNTPISVQNLVVNINENESSMEVNGNYVICTNNVIAPSQEVLCYINSSVCVYNPSSNTNPQLTIIYEGISVSKSIGLGYYIYNITSPLLLTIYNSQSNSTPSPFQQEIAICNGNPNMGNSFAYVNNPTIFNVVDPDGQNVYFTNSSGSLLYSWYEGQLNYNGVYCDVWWVNISSGIPANSNITIYMYIGSASDNYYSQYYPYVGASYNALGTFQYDNIGYVMNPGLMYQFYVNYTNWTAFNQTNWSEIYSLPLTQGTCQLLQGVNRTIGSYVDAISAVFCAYYNVNVNGSLPVVGTTQNVSGTDEPYVIVDWQFNYPEGGYPYPDPPISNPSPDGVNITSYGWIIKFIGFAVVNESNTYIYVLTDDGSNIEYSSFPVINIGFANWTTNNPNFIIQAFHIQHATQYNGSIPVGDWAFEYDYYEGPIQAYTALWSNNPIYYYSPSFPPNGIMPKIYIS